MASPILDKSTREQINKSPGAEIPNLEQGSLGAGSSRAAYGTGPNNATSLMDRVELAGVDTKKIDKLSNKISEVLNQGGDISSVLTDKSKREELTGILKEALKEFQTVAGAEVVQGQVSETIKGLNKLIRISSTYEDTMKKSEGLVKELALDGTLSRTNPLNAIHKDFDKLVQAEFAKELGNTEDNLAVSVPFVKSKVQNAKASL